jgi:hypothetical protein
MDTETTINLINGILINGIIDASKDAIKVVERDMKEMESLKLQAIMNLTLIRTKKLNFAVTEKLNFAVDFMSAILNTNKMEKMLYLAVIKQNWELLIPMRNKYREMADIMMETMERGVE